ncbi:Triacylglycerol lipase [Bertholletia excelsa]
MAPKFLLILFLLSAVTAARASSIPAVFAFGDSTVDPGNNNHLPTLVRGDHPPYGRNFPGRVPSGRFSDGKLTTDFLVSQLGLKPLLPAYLDPTVTDKDLLTGASFASAGSGLDEMTATETGTLTMAVQLNHFEEALGRMRRAVGPYEANRLVGNALFVIAAGTNDMVDNYYDLPTRRATYPMAANYHDFLLGRLESVIRRLYGMGARKFSLAGLPPIGCLPAQVTVGSFLPSIHMFQRFCVDGQNVESQAYNAKLQALTSRLQGTLPGARIAYAEIYNPILDMIVNPARYGFQQTLQGCCGSGTLEMGPLCNTWAQTCPDPSKYLFWDSVHPTQAAYSVLANNFYRTVLPQLVN